MTCIYNEENMYMNTCDMYMNTCDMYINYYNFDIDDKNITMKKICI